MSDKTNEKLNPRERPCPICNNSAYSWGRPLIGPVLVDERNPIYFRPYQSVFEDGDMIMFARRCNVCYNIQFFTID
jgi:hypothetical protein